MSGRHLHLHAGVEPALDWTAGSQPPLMPESISSCTHACRLQSHARSPADRYIDNNEVKGFWCSN